MGIRLLDKKRGEVVEVSSEQSANSLIATRRYELIRPVKQSEAKPSEASDQKEINRETTDQLRKPELKKQINISQDRNLSVCVWPPSGQYNTRAVTLQEGRRDESGKWANTKLFLPASALLALSEILRQVWAYLEERE